MNFVTLRVHVDGEGGLQLCIMLMMCIDTQQAA